MRCSSTRSGSADVFDRDADDDAADCWKAYFADKEASDCALMDATSSLGVSDWAISAMALRISCWLCMVMSTLSALVTQPLHARQSLSEISAVSSLVLWRGLLDEEDDGAADS